MGTLFTFSFLNFKSSEFRHSFGFCSQSATFVRKSENIYSTPLKGPYVAPQIGLVGGQESPSETSTNQRPRLTDCLSLIHSVAP